MIREKAAAYQRIWQDPSFYARYGRMPIPLWIVPDTTRADIIMRTWAEVWPAGRWCITTDPHLATLRAVEWHAGQQRAIGLLDGWAAT